MIGQHVPLVVTTTYSRRMTIFLDGLWLLLLFSYSYLFHVFPYCVYKIETEIMQDF